jgi:DNA-nicking Smr family endonuclease
MDFGDILDEWEGRTAKPAGKKGVSRGLKRIKGEPSRPSGKEGREPSHQWERVDPLTAWLRINGIEDKDAEAERAEVSAPERRRRLLAKNPDAAIDLHGLSRDEAWETLEAFFYSSRRQGFEKVLIIHGKGNHSGSEAVLKRMVRDFVERCPLAGESGHGSPVSGGGGSTWVLLKRPIVPGK